jgi:hypothetical protein
VGTDGAANKGRKCGFVDYLKVTGKKGRKAERSKVKKM